MSLTKYTSTETLPAYSPAAEPISPVEEKAALASHIVALPHELDPASVCAAYGHDSRPNLKTALALTVPSPSASPTSSRTAPSRATGAACPCAALAAATCPRRRHAAQEDCLGRFLVYGAQRLMPPLTGSPRNA
ncbi:uncharacterized protein LOC62_03G004037 [Vanrija pseudolonga]|uniref:Uncharacterized protein n=1 Tax=Vanrija pseudolonga TaxID=143232 RepID=A0AAF0YBC9_9TREE|nr:hypothetical protein LOC62_03G004037 [Vanrija pseudolonga]